MLFRSSLYGKVSWNINTAFFNSELHRAVPHLDTVEKQLKVVVNLLHALGKTVGLDVIPHNDRFSEIVLTYPRLFEWVRRNGPHITDHSEKVWVQVEEQIWQFLQQRGPADGSQLVFGKKVLFDPANRLLTDAQRQQIVARCIKLLILVNPIFCFKHVFFCVENFCFNEIGRAHV